MSRTSLALHSIVDFCYQLRKQGSVVNDDKILQIIIQLQHAMDYEELASVMIKRKQTEFFLGILGMKKLKSGNTKKALIASLKESARLSEFNFTYQLWEKYSHIMKEKSCFEDVKRIIVTSFVKSPQFLEVKTYLLI